MGPGTIRPRETPPLSLYLSYLNDYVIISRALISSRQAGYMVHAARASIASAPAPRSTRHFLIGCPPIKNVRNFPENNALNFSNRLKNSEFQRAFFIRFAPKNHESRVAGHGSRFTTHQSLLTDPAFLIASRQILEIELTRSQQTRKHFLIASFSDISAPAPHLIHHSSLIASHCVTPFLIDTNKTHRIITLTKALAKTKEKRFSIRYKFAIRGTGSPAAAGTLACPERTRRGCAPRFWFGRCDIQSKTNAHRQDRLPTAGRPMLPVLRGTNHQSLLTNHQSRLSTGMRLAWVCWWC
jgi:hypothetical protein